MTLKEVPKIHNTSLADVPGRLRELANQVENGEHGEVRCCAIVMWAIEEDGRSSISIFGYGPQSDHPNMTTTLLAGANDAAGRLIE